MEPNSFRLLTRQQHADAPQPVPDERLWRRPAEWKFEYDQNEVFPEVQIGLGLAAQLLWVTREIAVRLIAEAYRGQRGIRKLHLESLMRDHEAGLFVLNGEPILFDWNGKMINGKHRCTMVMETGKPALILTVKGLPPNVYKTLDNGARRTGADLLKAQDVPNATMCAAAARQVERYRLGLVGRRSIQLSPQAIDEMVTQDHPGIQESVAAVGGRKTLPARPTLAACLFVLSQHDREKADEFFYKLIHGTDLQEGDAVLALRNRFLKHRNGEMASDEAFQLVLTAWNLWRTGRKVKTLRADLGKPLPDPV